MLTMAFILILFHKGEFTMVTSINANETYAMQFTHMMIGEE